MQSWVQEWNKLLTCRRSRTENHPNWRCLVKTISKKLSLPESVMSRSDHDKTEEVPGRTNHVMSRWEITDISTSCGSLLWPNSFRNPLVNTAAYQKEDKDPLLQPQCGHMKDPQLPSVHEDTCPNHWEGGLQGHDSPGAVLRSPAPAAQLACEWAGKMGVCVAASVNTWVRCHLCKIESLIINHKIVVGLWGS